MGKLMFKTIRSWRISLADPSGMNLWFDPTTEEVVLLGSPDCNSESDSSAPRFVLRELLEQSRVVPYEGSDPEETLRGKHQVQISLPLDGGGEE